ncbi:MAG TPA: hypothetical protein VGO43_09580 [Pyrinomonadaceae bacterium]|nr:hypothetical protein [Pyrinomonadaceae bacterium]
MKKITLCLLLFCCAAVEANAQKLPAKITAFVKNHYTNWKAAAPTCDERNWILRGDFDGDGKQDYLLRFLSGKSAKKLTELNLLAFLNYSPNYIPANIDDFNYDSRARRSSFKVLKKGETIGGTKLENDSVMHYVCETDDAAVFMMKDGKWRAIEFDAP